MIPWRVCCGQQHLGIECPDGKYMCCYCFDRFKAAELAIDGDGNKIDVCCPCYNWEQMILQNRGRNNGTQNN